MPGDVWAETMRTGLAARDNVRIMTRTTVTGVYDGLNFGALERVGQHLPHDPDLPRECFWRIQAKAAVLAAGALERPIAFPMNDRPGIMLARRRTQLPQPLWRRTGTQPDALRHQRRRAPDGGRDAGGGPARGRRDRQPHGGGEEGRLPPDRGRRGDDTKGRQALHQITVRHGGQTEDIVTDCLAMSGGWNPSVHLTCHLGARPVWDADAKAFLPAPGAVPGMIPAGSCNGAMSTAACLSRGRRPRRRR
jgi:NADPH-dependent 2,4-dienoyl-CoA reductase/sulfur reductase-like enzyme